ncbi:MAG: hypothetical protein ACE5OO_00390 [Candidatus Bathyarchaeia archaeon]
MVYEFLVTVPANTPADSPVEEEALVHPGVVTHVEVEMAAGCHRMVKCAVYEGTYKMWPRNPEGAMATDAHVIAFNEYIELKRGHNLLKIKCWSPGTTYSHDVTVRIVVMPKHIAAPYTILDGLVNILKRILGLR